MAHLKRIVVLVDMDCFYCQVEENLNPRLKGKPLAVVQYNAWRGGGIIAVNYPARDQGVTRHMRGNDAKEKCPEIKLARVPEVRGKADLTKYREAGKRVAEVLQTFTPLLERASVDEAYLDITQSVETRIRDGFDITLDMLKNTFVVGCDTEDFIQGVKVNREFCESNYKLAIGGVIAEELREAVFKQTGYECSAGIAHNKILAKLVCGLHKPNKQTILPHDSVKQLFDTIPVKKITSLGGKFGSILTEKLNITNMGELSQFSEKELLQKFDAKTGNWLYNIARGIDLEPVTTRLVSKSIGCCKKFPGRTALTSQNDVDHWLSELSTEMSERLEKDLEENNRKAKQMVVSYSQEIKGEDISSTRSIPLISYEQQKMFQQALDVIKKNCLRTDGGYCVKFLGISVGNFEDVKRIREITSFFKNMSSRKRAISPELNKKQSNAFVAEAIRVSSPEIFSNYVNYKKRVGETDNVENEESSSDSSIYSKSTLEDETDGENLVYYEEIHPDSVQEQSFIDFQNVPENIDSISNDSNDSISQEIVESNVKLNWEMPPTSSFFAKYFENNRDFNTSKVLLRSDDENMSSELDENNLSDAAEINLDSNKTFVGNRVSPEVENNAMEPYKVCPDCSKNISSFEFQSHMDYHFALKMVRNEAHLYSNNKTETPSVNCKNRDKTYSNSSNKLNKTKKKPREAPVCDSNKTLLNFLSKDEETSEMNSEKCSECNKWIKIEELVSHLDFHAAKKLHLEINKNHHLKVQLEQKGCDGCSSDANRKMTSGKKKVITANNGKVKKVNSITNFLKPL